MKLLRLAIATGMLLLASSCGTYFNQPFDQDPARSGELSQSSKPLLDLPDVDVPVEVAVYNFSDQTGQYKAIETGSTFSTAVTQGGTTILIKALEDSGWFKPIERENLTNLSTERNIIRNTQQEYIKNLNPNEPPLPPLLYAGLILEGGIISYDTNIVTGGIGARYFGLGGSARYRQDRISVYLRAVSTSNGQILKTVYVSKTILSQALDASFFRFVKFQRLLEAETGITKNEPVQLAVQDAIEKAVYDLIMEGIEDGYWSTKEGEAKDQELIAQYRADKEAEQSTELYERELFNPIHKNGLNVAAGVALINADYSIKEPGVFTRIGYERRLTDNFAAEVSGSLFELNSGEQFRNYYWAADANLKYFILPHDDFGPYLFAGGGVFSALGQPEPPAPQETFFKFQYGAGLEYRPSTQWSIRLTGEHNMTFSDNVEGLVNGRRNDHYLTFGLGLNYKFDFKQPKN